MSPFARHRQYLARRTHVRDIKEPVVKALYYYRLAKKYERDAGPFSSIPEQRESYDFWVEKAQFDRAQCNRILAELHSSRQLERAIAHHAATEVAGAVKLSEIGSAAA